MKKNYFGTERMQDLGVHYMGANVKHEINKEDLELMNKKAEQERLAYVERLMEKDKDCKPYENKVLVPGAGRVVVWPYEKNPYRVPVRESSSGLILGDFETGSSYKSDDTGEQEAAQRGVWCCKVIAVGKECKTVVEGEDVYINFTMAAPLPFGGKGYYSISENNIICSVREK